MDTRYIQINYLKTYLSRCVIPMSYKILSHDYLCKCSIEYICIVQIRKKVYDCDDFPIPWETVSCMFFFQLALLEELLLKWKQNKSTIVY